MKDLKKNRDKVLKNQINRNLKPYIDKDLQLQLSDFSSDQNHESFPYHPVYAYSASSSSVDYSIFSQINESEIIRSMKEAEESFKAWNKIKEQLEKIKKNEETPISPPYLA